MEKKSAPKMILILISQKLIGSCYTERTFSECYKANYGIHYLFKNVIPKKNKIIYSSFLFHIIKKRNDIELIHNIEAIIFYMIAELEIRCDIIIGSV
jgi:hypothetical protein